MRKNFLESSQNSHVSSALKRSKSKKKASLSPKPEPMQNEVLEAEIKANIMFNESPIKEETPSIDFYKNPNYQELYSSLKRQMQQKIQKEQEKRKKTKTEHRDKKIQENKRIREMNLDAMKQRMKGKLEKNQETFKKKLKHKQEEEDLKKKKVELRERRKKEREERKEYFRMVNNVLKAGGSSQTRQKALSKSKSMSSKVKAEAVLVKMPHVGEVDMISDTHEEDSPKMKQKYSS